MSPRMCKELKIGDGRVLLPSRGIQKRSVLWVDDVASTGGEVESLQRNIPGIIAGDVREYC